MTASTSQHLPGDQEQNEGDSGTTNFRYTLDLIGSYAGTVTVDYAVTGSGSHRANSADFVGGFPAGTITFPSGSSQQTLDIPVQGDTLAENDEEFTITLSNVTGGADLGKSSITGTILNDESSTGPTTIYLPFATTEPPPYPDLVVESVRISDGIPTIMIRNQGNAAVDTELWIDLLYQPIYPTNPSE